MSKQFDLRKNNGGKRQNSGRKSKFIDPYKLNLTVERKLILSLRVKYGKRLNGIFCDFLKNLEKNDDFLK